MGAALVSLHRIARQNKAEQWRAGQSRARHIVSIVSHRIPSHRQRARQRQACIPVAALLPAQAGDSRQAGPARGCDPTDAGKSL